MQATEWILLPEITVSLIAEDTGKTLTGARNIMHMSSEYGSVVFPSDENSTADAIGEDIVRKRAMVRREEVVIEDKVEAMVMKQEGLWQDSEENGIRGESETNAIMSNVRGRPKPRPLGVKRP